MRTLTCVAAIAVVMGFGGLAQAGGLDEGSLKDDPVVYHSPTVWTGFYVGGHIAGASGESEVSRADGPPGPPGFSFDTEPDGVFAGAQVGYDWQVDQFVFGIVGDASVAGIDGDGSKPEDDDGPPAAFETGYDWIATIRARLGILMAQDALLYIHGGWAVADIGFQGIRGEGPWSDVYSEDTQSGWVLGAGLEWMVKPGVSLFAEYSYLDFGDQTFTPDDPPGSIEQDSELHAVKVGVNFKIGHDRMESLK